MIYSLTGDQKHKLQRTSLTSIGVLISGLFTPLGVPADRSSRFFGGRRKKGSVSSVGFQR